MKTLERVNIELKKQIGCYKEELEQIKATDDVYSVVENYHKLVTDFN